MIFNSTSEREGYDEGFGGLRNWLGGERVVARSDNQKTTGSQAGDDMFSCKDPVVGRSP